MGKKAKRFHLQRFTHQCVAACASSLTTALELPIMFRGCPVLRGLVQMKSNAQQAAEKLINSQAVMYAPSVLNRVQFEPNSIRVLKEGDMVFPFTGGKEATNAFKSMHGGALASLADMFTTLHLWGQDPQSRHVSVNFDIHYLAAAPVGGQFECITRIVKKGKRLCFTEFTFVNPAGDVLCKGTHTKAFI